MTARSEMEEGILDQAIAWQTALESDDADWDRYVAWLEADPRHREAFDTVALTSAAVDEHKHEIKHMLDAQASVGKPQRIAPRRWFLGGSVAAALALAVAIPTLWAPETVATYNAEMGKSRLVALANGTSVTLSPSSSIVVHGKQATKIELASGEAYFDVKHDPSRSLTVSAGGYRITDIGTQFSVNLSDGVFRVGVSDGTVSVASEKSDRDVQVSAGHQLVMGSDAPTLSRVAATEVASWRAGRLSYSDAPLRLVAADISRYSGKPVVVDASLEKSHFSGTLVIGDGSRLLPDLATVLGIKVEPAGNGARISAAGPSR
jgi:transmembrane sensor